MGRGAGGLRFLRAPDGRGRSRLPAVVMSLALFSQLGGCRDQRGETESFALWAQVTSGGALFEGSGTRTLRRERRAKISAETPEVVWHESGEATVVPLADGQALYVLLDGSDLPTATAAKLANRQGDKDLLTGLRAARAAGRSAATTGYDYVERHDRFRFPYPRMAYFLDPADPATLRFVRPGGRFELGGRSYRLAALWAAPASAAAKPGPIAGLDWLAGQDRGLSDPTLELDRNTPPPLAFASNFSTWYVKHD